MASVAPGLGAALQDRYRLELDGRGGPSLLGQGGMATVYLARDLRHDRQVAIKVLREDLARLVGPERFLREIRVTAQLHHPHILPVFDSGEAPAERSGDPPQLWYATPLVEGGSLRDLLERSGRVPLPDALRILRGVAGGLAHAHHRGIIHRDVKPENILLEDGEPLLADFGVARASAEAGQTTLTGTGLQVGTLDYMAPEQLTDGREVDARADLYALGVVAFEMLAGRRPFQLVADRFGERRPSVRALAPEVPESVDLAIGRALAVSPADRFGTVEEFLQALEVAAPTGAAVTTPPIRRRVPAAVAILVLLLAAVAAWTLPKLFRRPLAEVSQARLVALPFRVANSALAEYREGLVDLFASALDGAGGLRAIGARTALKRWYAAVGSDGQGDDEAVHRVAQALGARYALTGAVIPLGASIKLQAEVHDLLNDSTYKAEADGAPDSIAVLAQRVGTELLRRIAGPAARLVTGGPFATKSLEALKAYLAGEKAFRAAQYREAIAAFDRAIAADSNFALAQFRKGAAEGWTGSPHSPGGVSAVVRNALPRLGRRDSLVVRGSWELAAAQGAALKSFETLTRDYPDDAEGWYLLGDAYYHIGMAHGASMERADSSLRRAIALDSTFAPAYLHLIEDAFERNDTMEVRTLVTALTRFDSTSPKTGGVQVALELAFGTPAEREQARRRLVTLGSDALLPAKHALNLNPDLGEYTVLVGQQLTANPRFEYLARAMGFFGQGVVARFKGHFGSAMGLDSAGFGLLDSLDGLANPQSNSIRWPTRLAVLAVEGLPVPADWMMKWPPDALRDADPFSYGLAALVVRRWSEVTVAATRLQQLADTAWAGRSELSAQLSRENNRGFFSAEAALLKAWAEWLRTPSQVSLARFEAMADSLRHWDPIVNIADYVMGIAFLGEGDLDRAERHMLVPQHWNSGWNAELIVPREYYLGRIEEERGNKTAAREHYARFVRWWRDCDPELKPMWEDGRQRLAKVSGEPREP